MWDLKYKHLHILFTLQVALFRVVLAVFSFLFFQTLFSLIKRYPLLVYRRNHYSTVFDCD